MKKKFDSLSARPVPLEGADVGGRRRTMDPPELAVRLDLRDGAVSCEKFRSFWMDRGGRGGEEEGTIGRRDDGGRGPESNEVREESGGFGGFGKKRSCEDGIRTISTVRV